MWGVPCRNKVRRAESLCVIWLVDDKGPSLSHWLILNQAQAHSMIGCGHRDKWKRKWRRDGFIV